MKNSTIHPLFWAGIILISAMLQIAVPITGDEAYFIAWGKSFQWGYYDHPPVPGWISYTLWQVDDLIGLPRHGALHRLFSGLMGLASVYLILSRLRLHGLVMRPVFAAGVFVAVPGVLILFNLYLNDSVLAFFSLLFVLAVDTAFRARRNVLLALILAALAFDLVLLTKYNGALVYLGMLAGFLSWPAGRRFLFGRFVVISLLALPVFLAHLWWNADHCSVNLAFNFGFRSIHATGFGPVWVVLTLAIMAGPLAFGLLARIAFGNAHKVGFFARTFLGTVAVMLVISVLRGEFGVNWGAPLAALTVLAMVEVAPAQAPVWSRRIGLAASLALLLPLSAVLLGLKYELLPATALTDAKRAADFNQHLDLADGQLIRQIAPLNAGRVTVAMEYGIVAVLDNARIGPTTVFTRSVFGRNQDLQTDFSEMNGRDMVVLLNGAGSDTDEITRLFDSANVVTLTTSRQTYLVVLGQGFQYATYRAEWILPTISELYDKSPFPYLQCGMDKYRLDK